ncbi:MAG: hypothetical protein QOE98_3191, partial [Gaiellaceae bacterium]|nr:hypothetical protein [Gaiellaceae bacterium]
MELRRRELLKLAVFGSAALLLPIERVARTELALRDRMPASRLPKQFTVPFTTPPVLKPVRATVEEDYYDIVQMPASVEILPGLQTEIWGYNGITPGPTIVNTQGRSAVVQIGNNLPGVHPDLRYE